MDTTTWSEFFWATRTHARLWPATARRLCRGDIGAEPLTDDDHALTCEQCLRAMREASAEVRP